MLMTRSSGVALKSWGNRDGPIVGFVGSREVIRASLPLAQRLLEPRRSARGEFLGADDVAQRRRGGPGGRA